MKFIFYSLIIIFCISNFSFAGNQIDTLGVLSYFPMHVSDQWQYQITYNLRPLDTSYYSITITDYTLKPNNKLYYEFDYGSFPDYIRVDSSDLKVYRYEAVPSIPDSEYVYYELIKPDPDTTLSWFWFFDTTFGQVGNLQYFRKQNMYLWDYFGTENQTRYLSQDFGLSSIVRDDGWGSLINYNLIAAKIDSVVYGQFVTSINQIEKINNFALHQNFPNPFNQTTIIKFSLEKIEIVKIEVFNLLGEKVETLLKKQLPAGSHQVEFIANDLPSGVYLYKIEAGQYHKFKKMILLK